MFPCERCGCCCRKVGELKFVQNMALSDGTCKYLDKQSNLCKIYDNRPIFCRVDDFYDKFLSQTISRDEFYQKNKVKCRLFQGMQNLSKNL